MNCKDCMAKMAYKDFFVKFMKSLSKNELYLFTYIIVLFCIWFSVLGTHVANLDNISGELLGSAIVSCAYISVLWYLTVSANRYHYSA